MFLSLPEKVLNMKFSIGVKEMPEYGLSGGQILRDPQELDWFNGITEVLLYMDENLSLLNADLKAFGLENTDLCILKKRTETPRKGEICSDLYIFWVICNISLNLDNKYFFISI